MEGILALLALLAGGWFLLAPGIALASAWGAAARQKELERRFGDLEIAFAGVTFRAEQAARARFAVSTEPIRTLAPPDDAVAADAARRAREIDGLAAQAAADRVAVDAAPMPATLVDAAPMPATLVDAAPMPAALVDVAPQPAAVVDATGVLDALAARAAARRDARWFGATEPAAPIAPPPTFPAASKVGETRPAADAADVARKSQPPVEAERPGSLEEQLGVTWLTRAGAAAFLLGALFFFKHAIDESWIGPVGRVVLGAAVGVGLLGAAEILRKTARAHFVHALAGIGLAVLFVTVWASSAFYTLTPRPVAFVLNGALALFGAALALRHKGQPILILALVAAFLNPIVLVSHGDHGAELFLYLFVVTGVSELVAMKLRFPIVTQLGILGVAGLFGAWLDRQGGWVGSMPHPALALGIVAAFAGFWLWAAVRVARDPDRRLEGALRAAEALALAQIAVAVVFSGSAASCVAASLVVAGAGAFVSRRLDAHLLLAPLLVGAFAFGAIVFLDGSPGGLTLPLLGVWAAVFVAAALDFAPRGSLATDRALLAATPLGVLALLATELDLTRAPALAVLIMAGVALAGSWIAKRAERPALALAFAAGTGGLVAAIAARFTGDAPLALLLAAGAWTVAVAIPALRSPRIDPSQGRHGWETPLGAAIGAVGFSATAVLATRPEAETLRAGLLGGAGLFSLALAFHASERREDGDAGALFGGLALALGSAAVAFAFQGATITVLWAILAVLAAVVARRTESVAWQTIAGAVFVAALGRALLVDVGETLVQADRFMASRGAEGVLAPPAFANPRALALAATAIALLVGARITWWMKDRTPSRVAAIAGYVTLLSTLAVELRNATRALPAAPAQPVGDAAWADFLARYEAVTTSGHDARTMFTTLVLAVGAAALLSLGFGFRSTFHRWLGLALFLITVAKLALWDVWHVGSVEQVVLLTGVGALLVAGGFLYARFGKRLVAMMQGGAESERPA